MNGLSKLDKHLIASRRPVWRTAIALLCCILLPVPRPARADTIQNAVIGVAVAVGVVGAGIGIGLYYAINHKHSIRGCISGGPGALLLTQKDDPQAWTLTGNAGDLRVGEVVRVEGKKMNKSGGKQFAVEKLKKDYGTCPAH